MSNYTPIDPVTGKPKNVGGRPSVITEDALTKLRQAFLMGCSDIEACLFAEVSKASLYRYQDEHPEFRDQKEEWKEQPTLKARATIYKTLNTPDTAKWYLERKKKGEFAQRQELTGPDGDNITVSFHNSLEVKENKEHGV